MYREKAEQNLRLTYAENDIAETKQSLHLQNMQRFLFQGQGILESSPSYVSLILEE